MMYHIDWDAVLENLNDHLREAMRGERQCDPDDERNPYTFRIFGLQEMIGSIERGHLSHAYLVIAEEFGEEYFDDFLL